MLTTYKAILKGNRLEWSGAMPILPPPERALAVYVTILDKDAISLESNPPGQRMAAALEQLAAAHSLAELADPAAWEREIRQDRPLPGRDV